MLLGNPDKPEAQLLKKILNARKEDFLPYMLPYRTKKIQALPHPQKGSMKEIYKVLIRKK